MPSEFIHLLNHLVFIHRQGVKLHLLFYLSVSLDVLLYSVEVFEVKHFLFEVKSKQRGVFLQHVDKLAADGDFGLQYVQFLESFVVLEQLNQVLASLVVEGSKRKVQVRNAAEIP